MTEQERKSGGNREEEYIVLNRREEGTDREEASGGVATDYEKLRRYRYFDGEAIWKSMRLTQALRNKAAAVCQQNRILWDRLEVGYVENMDGPVGEAFGEGKEGRISFPVEIGFSRDQILYAECQCSDCRRHYFSRYYRREYCPYLGALMMLTREYLAENNVGDATDLRGMRIMQALYEQHANNVLSDTVGKEESLTLAPRLTLRDGDLSVSFRVGEKKLFVVKDLFEFYRSVQESAMASYGSSTKLNHRLSNFTESSRQWVDYIGRIVREEQAFERRMIEARSYSRRAASRNGELDIFGWRLDELYRLLEGAAFEFENKDGEGRSKSILRTREQNPRISMTIRRNGLGTGQHFHGVSVDCRMPQFFYGVRTAYYVEGECFCRMEEDFLEKIRTIARFSQNGGLSFQVGINRLAEFYHSVLPRLEGAVDIMEENADEIAAYLPPQAEFIFYLDAENQNMSCRVSARYGEQEIDVTDVLAESGQENPPGVFRNYGKEEEIVYLVCQWFPLWDHERRELHCGQDEERMFRVLDGGVDALLALGEVQCTRRFSNLNVGRRVRMSVGISVSKGLLNLDIATQDIPPEELLDILKSYRQKKKYYRLRNGDFISLDEEGSVRTLAEMMDALRMTPGELLKGRVSLPLYRALYLNKLLEKNEEIYSRRDSYFREMVKNFKTVNDADFEEPPTLRGVLRGYQRNGYRWLRTLEAYHLGGILADDMGLGKTLQVLAVLLAAKLEGKKGTSLVVAPASLVYNWGEEIRKLTPQISYDFITGSQEERREKLVRHEEYDVIITSYDLLKRDIENYENMEFRYQIIDEAQYIKNHTTAAAKAVKAIRSGTRYALTGTPIENRLSELWSIFDFLIPGYLYGYDVFKNEFEAPIIRNEDRAALERLQRMTAPFILRRMKENVLRDLPEKLEESRYVRFEQEQQKLYDAQVVHMRQKIAMQDSQEFQKNKIQILAELMKLRQICCDPGLCFENYKGESAKLEASLDLVKSAIEGGHKILLFSQFTSMLELIAGRMEREGISFYTITGATPKEKRLQLVKAFNGDETKVFLISLKAGGVGLNLTGADVVIHYDPWWNLAVQNQATDRTHRIGQTKVVVVYKLIAKGTIEEKIQELQESKRALSEQVIQGDAGQLSAMSREDFISLLS